MVNHATETNGTAAEHACPAAYLMNAAAYLRTSAEWALTLAEPQQETTGQLRGAVVVPREELKRHAKTLLSHAEAMTEAANATPKGVEAPAIIDLVDMAEKAEAAWTEGDNDAQEMATGLYAVIGEQIKLRQARLARNVR